MNEKKPADLLRMLEDMALDDELERITALSDEELDREMKAEGFNPAAIGENGARFAAEQMARRERLAWQAEAHDRLELVRAKLSARAQVRPVRSRDELLTRIAKARLDPRLAQPVAVMFRNRVADEASDEELESILEEIEALAEHGN